MLLKRFKSHEYCSQCKESFGDYIVVGGEDDGEFFCKQCGDLLKLAAFLKETTSSYIEKHRLSSRQYYWKNRERVLAKALVDTDKHKARLRKCVVCGEPTGGFKHRGCNFQSGRRAGRRGSASFGVDLGQVKR